MMKCPKASPDCLGCIHATPHEKKDTCLTTVCKFEGMVKCIEIKGVTDAKN